jgi:hypothetical protein
MFKVQYKSQNAYQSWANYGSYGSETSAMGVASRISARYFMVRVTDRYGHVLYAF